MHFISFTIVHRYPVTVKFGYGIRTSRIKRSRFFLWYFLHQTIKFGCGSLVNACLGDQVQQTNRFQYAQNSQAIGISRIFGSIETHFHMAHGRQIINLIRLGLTNDTSQIQTVGQVTIMQDQITVFHMRVLIKMIDTIRVKHRRPTFDTMHYISFLDQIFGQVSSVLPCYSCY